LEKAACHASSLEVNEKGAAAFIFSKLVDIGFENGCSASFQNLRQPGDQLQERIF
jgi:hypothetical protein